MSAADEATLDARVAALLERARTIAVVGMSRTPGKPAHDVPAQLLARGFHVIPVNPSAEEILGLKCYPNLEAVAEHVDVVDVFRPSADVPQVAEAAARIGADALWLQLGITSERARDIAARDGLEYVEDRCIAIEARRLDIHKG